MIVLTTLPDRLHARRLSELVLKKRLAACIQQVGPIESVYRWKKKIERAKEYLLILKTRNALFPRLKQVLEKNHPYSVPEIVALPCARANSAYLQWLKAETQI
ncbi:MAG: divalent-cation tolerance protein CutA [Candidatus Omnitrophica bacterium]|nr:divalent-cation tolerance protein CutA [Candidatus Omnitrophota bacterium]